MLQFRFADRIRIERAEKLGTISYWENVEVMSRCAGKDPPCVHHLERDPELLIELPRNCTSRISSPATAR
jgi:hypothetical protein